MTTAINPIICAEDPLIDMVYITTYTGMTDKWFYKLYSEWRIPETHQTGTEFPLV
jgi:predicted DNA-binding transcriptional regulator AlpA